MSINDPRWRHILLDFRADLRRRGIKPAEVPAELLEPGSAEQEARSWNSAETHELRWLTNGHQMPAGWRFANAAASHHDAWARLIERADE